MPRVEFKSDYGPYQKGQIYNITDMEFRKLHKQVTICYDKKRVVQKHIDPKVIEKEKAAAEKAKKNAEKAKAEAKKAKEIKDLEE